MTHLPRFIYESNDTLVILPIFFTAKLLRFCHGIETCAHLCALWWLFFNCRASAIQPANKQELLMCVRSKLCTSEKALIRTHVGAIPAVNGSFT